MPQICSVCKYVCICFEIDKIVNKTIFDKTDWLLLSVDVGADFFCHNHDFDRSQKISNYSQQSYKKSISFLKEFELTKL